MTHYANKGAFSTTRRLLPLVRHGGAIVFTSSKAALRAFAKVLAAELLLRSIRVNVISLGSSTRHHGCSRCVREECAAFMKIGDAVTPVKRYGTVEEAARAVLLLAFDATFTTGARLTVDGGRGQDLSPIPA